jgi:hypothetical protein
MRPIGREQPEIFAQFIDAEFVDMDAHIRERADRFYLDYIDHLGAAGEAEGVAHPERAAGLELLDAITVWPFQLIWVSLLLFDVRAQAGTQASGYTFGPWAPNVRGGVVSPGDTV